VFQAVFMPYSLIFDIKDLQRQLFIMRCDQRHSSNSIMLKYMLVPTLIQANRLPPSVEDDGTKITMTWRG
jgi:hypothetical protein